MQRAILYKGSVFCHSTEGSSSNWNRCGEVHATTSCTIPRSHCAVARVALTRFSGIPTRTVAPVMASGCVAEEAPPVPYQSSDGGIDLSATYESQIVLNTKTIDDDVFSEWYWPLRPSRTGAVPTYLFTAPGATLSVVQHEPSTKVTLPIARRSSQLPPVMPAPPQVMTERAATSHRQCQQKAVSFAKCSRIKQW